MAMANKALVEAYCAAGQATEALFGAQFGLRSTKESGDLRGQIGAHDTWLHPPHPDSEWRKFYVAPAQRRPDAPAGMGHAGDNGAILKMMRLQLGVDD